MEKQNEHIPEISAEKLKEMVRTMKENQAIIIDFSEKSDRKEVNDHEWA